MGEELKFFDMTDVEMKEWLEDNPARVDDGDQDGWTLLCTAARKGNTDLLEWLVDEKGASVHCTTPEGHTPLHLAGSYETASSLLARGADATALNAWGWTPLMKRAFNENASCVARLLEEPQVIATIDTQATESNDYYSTKGDTALHLICYEVGVTPVEEQNQILEMLLRAGADPTILNDDQETLMDAHGKWPNCCPPPLST